MPSERQIRSYWSEWLSGRISDKFDSPQEAMEEGVCFACGMTADGGIERAHIIPRCDGGSDEPDNLHMLCRTCHKDSEFLSGDAYRQWFEERTAIDMLMSKAVRNGGANLWRDMQANTAPPVARPTTNQRQDHEH